MKLVINYDFFEYISKINNSDSNLVLVKSRSKRFIKADLPFYTLFCMATGSSLKETIGIVSFEYLFTLALLNLDKVKERNKVLLGQELKKNKYQLISLASKLNDLNISTEYELLLQSELYYKETKFILNDYHLPDLMVKKYINIPAYDYSGDIKPISVEQEHIIGTKEYVLSLGSPKSVRSFATQGI